MAAKKVTIEFEARVGKLEKELQGIQEQLDKVTKKSKESGKAVTGIEANSKKVIGSLKKVAAAVGLAFGVREVIRFGQEMVTLAGKAQGVEAAFKRIGSAALLDDLREATKGTVSDLQLMQQAVRARNFDIPLTQLASLFDFARRRAKETGEEVDYLVESIILGIGRKSPLILDNLGISAVKLRQELKGVSTESATVGDVAEVVGRIASEAMASMGEETITAADRQQQLRAEFLNTQRAIGEKLIPVFNSFLSAGNTLLGLVNDLAGGTDKLSESLGKEQVEVNSLVLAITSLNEDSTIRKDLIDELQGKFGAYFTNLDLEKAKNQDIADAMKAINDQFADRIKLAVMEEDIAEAAERGTKAYRDQREAAEQYGASLQELMQYTIDNANSGKDFSEIQRIINDTTLTQQERTQQLIKAFDNLGGMSYKATISQQGMYRQGIELASIIQDLDQEAQAYTSATEDLNEATNDGAKLQEAYAKFLKETGILINDNADGKGDDADANEKAALTLKALNEQLKKYKDDLADATLGSKEWYKIASDIKALEAQIKYWKDLYDAIGQAKNQLLDITKITRNTEQQQTQAMLKITKSQEETNTAIVEGLLERQQKETEAHLQRMQQYEEMDAKAKELAQNARMEAMETSLALVGGMAEISGAMVNLFGNLSASSEASARFQRDLALFNLAVQSAEAIGAAIVAAFKNPASLTLAQQVAQVAASTALVLNNIARARQLIRGDVPTAPQFAEGGMVGGQLHSSGGTMIEAERGEYVINRKMTAKYKDAVTAINKGYFDKYVLKHYVAPLQAALAQPQQSFADNIAESIMEQQSRYLKKISRGVMVTNIRDIAKHMQGPNINRFKA